MKYLIKHWLQYFPLIRLKKKKKKDNFENVNIYYTQ